MSTATVEIADPRDKHQYSISDLSDEFKVTARALRFYEDEGLINPIRRGLTRVYTSGIVRGWRGYCGPSGWVSAWAKSAR
jgi:hypothetical protein